MTNEQESAVRGLMVFWANIAREHYPAFQRWHTAEHIPERVGIAGFVCGYRYRSVRDDTRFVMYYETHGPEVLTSEAYRAALNNPTERTRGALTWFRNPMRNTYALCATWGHAGRSAAPIVVTAQIPEGSIVSKAPSASVSSEVPAPLSGHGVRRVRKYSLDPAGSSMRTNETSLHGARAGSSGGLLMLESDDLRLLDRPDAWTSLEVAVREWARADVGEIGDIEVSSVEFALEAARLDRAHSV